MVDEVYVEPLTILVRIRLELERVIAPRCTLAEAGDVAVVAEVLPKWRTVEATFFGNAVIAAVLDATAGLCSKVLRRRIIAKSAAFTTVIAVGEAVLSAFNGEA